MLKGVDYAYSHRRGSTGNIYGGGSTEAAVNGEMMCSNHPIERVSSVCQHQHCGKGMCKRCEDGHHDLDHRKDVMPLVQFVKKASSDLEQSIRSIKDVRFRQTQHKSKLDTEVRQHRQSIISFVEQFFTQLQTDLDKASEKVICQLETRYLSIRTGNSTGVAEHLTKSLSYQLPKLEVDLSMICLETVLKRMIYVKKDVTHIGDISVASKGIIPTAVGGASRGISSGGGSTGGAGTISTAVGPAIVVTAPLDDDVVKQSTITTNQKQFGFPQTAYKPPPPRLDEKRNMSLQKEGAASRVSSRHRLSPDPLKNSTIRDPLLFTSRLYNAHGEKAIERPSLPTQPFAQILKTTQPDSRAPLKEYIASPNLNDKGPSQKTFSPYEIQQILKKTSAAKKDAPRESTTVTTFFESKVEKQKENKDYPFGSTQQYFNITNIGSPTSATTRTDFKFDNIRPSTFTELPSPSSASDLNRANEFRVGTFTELPSYDKPTTSTYEYKYRRQEYTTGGDPFKL